MPKFNEIASVRLYGEPLVLSVETAPRQPDDDVAMTFAISYNTWEGEDDDYGYMAKNKDMYRDLNVALRAFNMRASVTEPWSLTTSHFVSTDLQKGQSVSVPLDGLKAFTDAIYPRYPVDRHPESYTLAMFAIQPYNPAFPLARIEYPEQPVGVAHKISVVEAGLADGSRLKMDIVRNPDFVLAGQPSRLIRVEQVTAEGVAEGTEYFHDIDMACRAFEGRKGEYPEMASGFGIRLAEDGGRIEPKDRIASQQCVSLPVSAVEEIIRLIDKNGLSDLAEFSETINDIAQRTYNAGELAVAALRR